MSNIEVEETRNKASLPYDHLDPESCEAHGINMLHRLSVPVLTGQSHRLQGMMARDYFRRAIELRNAQIESDPDNKSIQLQLANDTEMLEQIVVIESQLQVDPRFFEGM